jgi:hypothetical protein
MRLDEANWLFAHSTSVLFIIALILMCFGLFADPVEILKTFGFPVSKLYGDRGQTDLVIHISRNQREIEGFPAKEAETTQDRLYISKL